MGQDSARACYGAKHVEVAHERLAVQTLLIADSLFRLVKYSESNQQAGVVLSLLWCRKYK